MMANLISYRSKNNFSTVQDAWLFSLHQRHGTFINQRATLSLNGIWELLWDSTPRRNWEIRVCFSGTLRLLCAPTVPKRAPKTSFRIRSFIKSIHPKCFRVKINSVNELNNCQGREKLRVMGKGEKRCFQLSLEESVNELEGKRDAMMGKSCRGESSDAPGSNYVKGGGRASFCRGIVPVAADLTPSTEAAREAEGLYPVLSSAQAAQTLIYCL